MPSREFVIITFCNWLDRFSRMRFRTGLVAIRTSKAATIPPSILGTSRWAMTAASEAAS